MCVYVSRFMSCVLKGRGLEEWYIKKDGEKTKCDSQSQRNHDNLQLKRNVP